MSTVLLIPLDGPTKDLLLTGDDAQRLATLQQTVGGYIEMVRLSEDTALLVNEDGLALSLPLNRRASQLGMSINGPVIVCGLDGSKISDVPPTARAAWEH